MFQQAGFAHFKAERFPLQIPFHGLTDPSISYLQFIVNLNVLLLSFRQLLLVTAIALGLSENTFPSLMFPSLLGCYHLTAPRAAFPSPFPQGGEKDNVML